MGDVHSSVGMKYVQYIMVGSGHNMHLNLSHFHTHHTYVHMYVCTHIIRMYICMHTHKCSIHAPANPLV